MKKDAFRYLEPLRVRWAEVDMQKVVFNVHYLMYIDTAVAGYWRALALPYTQTMVDLAGDLFVRKSSIEYFASAQYDDRLEVGLRCARTGTSSMLFEAAVFRGEETLVTAELVYVFADPHLHRSKPIAEPLKLALSAFEAGEPMVTVTQVPWSAVHSGIVELREQVFVDEMKWPASWVSEPADTSATHLALVNRLGRVIGAGRITVTAENSGQLSHCVIDRGARGSGYGTQWVHAAIQWTRSQGLSHLVVDAPSGLVNFFAQAGFRCDGPLSSRDAQAHQRMTLALSSGIGLG